MEWRHTVDLKVLLGRGSKKCVVHIKFSLGEIITRWQQSPRERLILYKVPIVSNLLNLMNHLIFEHGFVEIGIWTSNHIKILMYVLF